MEETKQSIKVNIADRQYPFSIYPMDEEEVRMAVKMINERLENSKKRFQIQDNQDALAITAFQFVVQLLREKRNDNSGIILSEISTLDAQLKEYIDNNLS